MPTCLASSSGLFRSSAQIHNSYGLFRLVSPRPCRCKVRRYASTSSSSPSSPKHQDRPHLLTVLHKTTALLPRILPHKVPPDALETYQPVTLDFWEDVLSRVYEDLTMTAKKRDNDCVRVAVYGVDWQSGSNELVAALLEDPFASDEQKHQLRARWNGRPEGSRSVKIQYGAVPSAEGDDVVRIQSSWLQHFGVPIEVTELQSLPSVDRYTAKTLFTADIPIILVNPISTSLASLFSDPATAETLPLSRRNTLLAVLSPSPKELTVAAHRSLLASQDTLSLVYVDPARALHGLGMLSGGPASAISIQRYQDDFSGSNVSSVTQVIKELLAKGASPGSTPSEKVSAAHVQTGRALVANALATCRSVLRKAEREADRVLSETSRVRSQMEEAKAKVDLEVFGSAGKDKDEISKALAQAKRSVQPTMDALQWYKLFWRVDDVRDVVTAAVDRAWCRDLERKLVFHAGRLGALQTSFAESTNAFSRSFASASHYHSPVLLNALARIATSPSYPVTPAALTAPLRSRQSQLAAPTERLHTAAQGAVVGMSGSVLGGFGLAWAGWASELHLLGGVVDVGMSAETALGAGLLAAAVGVRWAVGRWDRAKKRWWRDWDRVGDGLERDLKTALARSMDEQVVAVPVAACAGLEAVVVKRRSEIQELEEEVQRLEHELGRHLDQIA